MIYYNSGGVHILTKICRCSGSVFGTTLLIAAPGATISIVLYCLFPDGSITFFNSNENGVLAETAPWAGFSFLVGFLIVFRTSQAYSRFWEGCTAIYRMRSEWFDAVSALMTFTKHSQASLDDIQRFKELFVRLTSMLHAAALAELEAGESSKTGELWANSYEVIDPSGVDTQSIENIKHCSMKTSLIFTWLQQLIVENTKGATVVLSIPPPILSRVFQELANGMVAFEDAMRIAYIPFPFPYAQACDTILVIHWLLAPIVTSQWVKSAVWAGIFTFIQIFIFWSLNLIAIEIDHPFGKDPNDFDGEHFQKELNKQLVLLLSRTVDRTPRLSARWTPFLSLRNHDDAEDMVHFDSAPRSATSSHYTCVQSTDGSSMAHLDSLSVPPSSLPSARRPSNLRETFLFASHGSFATQGTSSDDTSIRPSKTSCKISEMNIENLCRPLKGGSHTLNKGLSHAGSLDGITETGVQAETIPKRQSDSVLQTRFTPSTDNLGRDKLPLATPKDMETAIFDVSDVEAFLSPIACLDCGHFVTRNDRRTTRSALSTTTQGTKGSVISTTSTCGKCSSASFATHTFCEKYRVSFCRQCIEAASALKSQTTPPITPSLTPRAPSREAMPSR